MKVWIIEEIRTDVDIGEEKYATQAGEVHRWPGPTEHDPMFLCGDKTCDCHCMRPMTLEDAMAYFISERTKQGKRIGGLLNNPYWIEQLRNIQTDEVIPLTILDVVVES